jgi:hypothetical protein
MAMNDGLKTPHRDAVAEPREGMAMLPVILSVVVALALGWWFFGDRLMPSNTSRTSTPGTGSPTSGTSTNMNTSNSSSSKQP